MCAFMLIAASCGPGAEPKTSISHSSAKPSPSSSPKPILCPLTGTEAPSGTDVNRPVLAVKIENSTLARPQAGLDAADLVYEELAEGGITRFMALFQCNDPASLGPIRSARLVDPDILVQFAPVLFAFSGANPIVDAKVNQTAGIKNLEQGPNGSAYHRERGRPGPHDLFSSSAQLRALTKAAPSSVTSLFKFVSPSPTARITPSSLAKHSPSPTRSKTRSSSPSVTSSPSPSPTPLGVTATSVSWSYSGPQNITRYTYDAALGAYLRFHGQTPHKSVTGKQIAVTNVVVLQVRVTQGTIKDAAGNFSPDIAVVGRNPATVVRGGRAISCHWERAKLSDRMRLIDDAGHEVELTPGVTWVHLVPTDQVVTVS